MNHTVQSHIPELALALTRKDSLARLATLTTPTLASCLAQLQMPLAHGLQAISSRRIERIHLGNEFCERLLPTVVELRDAMDTLSQQRLALTLVTPMLTDAGMRRLTPLLALLPDGCEVVVNDWGTRQRMTAYPALVPVLGRLLNKMIKDPRLPSPQWSALHPHQGQSTHFQRFMDHQGISQVEMDVPPFAHAEQFNSGRLGLSVHLPYGYAVKGRMCRIGSLGLPDEQRFSAGHGCHKECLSYWAEVEREGPCSAAELSGFQRGNTQFYRHSRAMSEALDAALARGWVNRLIVAGDWHEHHHTA
ncbi:hypothetical protein L3X16_12200 [Pseudomonas stutzeri]|nr:hypothetical protein [Stutzerimonas stutzeri]